MQPKPIPPCFVAAHHLGRLRKLEPFLGGQDLPLYFFKVAGCNRAPSRLLPPPNRESQFPFRHPHFKFHKQYLSNIAILLVAGRLLGHSFSFLFWITQLNPKGAYQERPALSTLRAGSLHRI